MPKKISRDSGSSNIVGSPPKRIISMSQKQLGFMKILTDHNDKGILVGRERGKIDFGILTSNEAFFKMEEMY